MNNKIFEPQNYDRIPSLDFLRGIAVLGILIINIESFAYFYPFKLMHGFVEPVDITTRFWVYFLAQGKFFAMFTLLFGAGFYIFLERLEAKGYDLKALDIYSRRLLWLFFFGVIHAYLIWDGDVLYHYAVCGFLLFPFRSMSVKKLSVVLLILISIQLFNSYQRTSYTQQQYQDYTQALEVEEDQRSYQQDKAIEKWQKKTHKKDLSYVKLETPRMTLMESWSSNFEKVKVHKGTVFYSSILFRTLITMILGIILYKLGVFQNYQAVKYYWPITISILTVALYMNYSRYEQLTYSYYEPVKTLGLGWLHTFPKEILGFAYILFFNGVYQKFLKNIKFKPVSTLGKMALSNYIFQSIVCGVLFYGYGLGWFNQFSRSELWMIIPVIWLIQLFLSFLWMKKFKQGPLEYIWRRLTYSGINESGLKN
jgi:uncharacterized protein